MRRLTPQEFIQRAKKIHGDRYDYSKITHIYSAEKLPILCKHHGIFYQQPHNHLAGKGCPECAGRLTLKSFVAKAKQIHGAKYSYDKADYLNNSTKIMITCPIHGDFSQQPHKHLKGQGCPFCARALKYSTTTFMQKAVSVHGKQYSYAKAKYIGFHKKLIITCPIHGDFAQPPSNHLAGLGCPECGRLTMAAKRRMPLQGFFDKAKKIHGTKYCYDKVNYQNKRTKVTITCPMHGDFTQTPDNHLKGNGCPRCGKLNAADKRRMTLEVFINKTKQIHGTKYNYDKVNYQGSDTKVIITCPIHGGFTQTPSNHLKGRGCPQCGGYARLTQKDFISRAESIHGDKYSYEKTVFNTVHHPVIITCPFHGDFEQSAEKHLRGHGCRKCRMPRGERDIELYLKKNNINYEYQYSPEGLRSKQKLFFDFCIKIAGSIGLIEYHGVQHYKAINFGGGVSDHAGNLVRDRIKERYAKDKNIPLLSISYKDSTCIPNLLTDFIKNLGTRP